MKKLATLALILLSLTTREGMASTPNAYDILDTVYSQFTLPTNTHIQAAFETCYNFNVPVTNKSARAQLDVWMGSLKGPFDQVSTAIRTGHLQFPPFDVHNAALPQLAGFRQIARCEVAKARLLMEEKDHQGAGVAFLETFQMGQLMMEGKGPLIHYLVGTAVQGMGIKGVMSMSTNSGVTTATLQFLLQKFPDAPERDADLAEAFRGEWKLSVGQCLDDIQQLVSSPTNGSPVAIGTNVFDRAATITMLNTVWGRMTTNATSSWLGRDQRMEADLLRITGCQADATEGFFWDYAMCFGDTNEQAKCWAKVLKKARKMPNILGREYVSIMRCGVAPLEKSVRCRTERNIVRTMLAITLYKRQTGNLPESLDDLVSSGTLDRVPVDLFSGKPLLYSKEKGIVWSVGPDGRNNKGHKDEDIVRGFLAGQ